MRGSLRSTAFKLFDKIILGALILLTVFYVAFAILRKPHSVVDPAHVRSLIGKIEQTQAKSRHTQFKLDKDYLSSTVGGFRPDIAGFEPRPYIMGGGKAEVHVAQGQPVKLLTPLEGRHPKAVRRKAPRHLHGAEIRIRDPRVVKVEWSDQELGTLVFTPLKKSGHTTVEVIQAKKTRWHVSVTVRVQSERKPRIGAPPRVDVAAGQGQVELSWARSPATNATLNEYRVYKGEKEEELKLYLRVPVPDELPARSVLPSRRPDGEPGPDVVFGGAFFRLQDRRVAGGVPYWYSVEAAGKTNKQQLLVSDRTEPVRTQVEEAFKIKFYTYSPDAVGKMVVSVFHQPEVGHGRWLDHSFVTIKRGQEVGWVVHELRLPDENLLLKNVDFSTGYQVFDILNDQRRINKDKEKPIRNSEGEVIGVRQHEETRQKVLLVSRRGRIKVLWPAIRGQK